MLDKIEDKCMIIVPPDFSEEAADRFEHHLMSCLDQGSNTLWLDCSLLHQACSRHVGVLWQARQMCEGKGVRICLKWPSQGLIRVLKALDLEDFFLYEESELKVEIPEKSRVNQGQAASTYSDDFKAEMVAIDSALEKFGAFLNNAGISPETAFELRTVFYEVAQNIRSYSDVGRTGEIDFSVRIVNHNLEMEFADRGVPFNPTLASTEFDPSRAARERQTRGFGLIMIRKLTDGISYVRNEDGTNRFILEKNIGE